MSIANATSITSELETVKKIVVSLTKAQKNCMLYPPVHAICLNGIHNTKCLLDHFFQTHDGLKLHVENNHFFYQGEIVYSAATPGNMPSLLFRDGILWFALLQDIELEEIISFFEIIQRYKALSDIAEGDIATALTEQ